MKTIPLDFINTLINSANAIDDKIGILKGKKEAYIELANYIKENNLIILQEVPETESKPEVEEVKEEIKK